MTTLELVYGDRPFEQVEAAEDVEALLDAAYRGEVSSAAIRSAGKMAFGRLFSTSSRSPTCIRSMAWSLQNRSRLSFARFSAHV